MSFLLLISAQTQTASLTLVYLQIEDLVCSKFKIMRSQKIDGSTEHIALHVYSAIRLGEVNFPNSAKIRGFQHRFHCVFETHEQYLFEEMHIE